MPMPVYKVDFVKVSFKLWGEEYDRWPILYLKDPPTVTITSGKASPLGCPAWSSPAGRASGGLNDSC